MSDGAGIGHARLGDVLCEVYRYPSYYGIQYVAEGVPEVRGELIRPDGSLERDLSLYRRISVETAARFPRTRLLEGDFVMSVRGTIGKIANVPASLIGANITANLIRLSPKRTAIAPSFLQQVFLSTSFQAQLEGATSSTTIKTIKSDELRGLLIPLPPLGEQRKIAAILSSVDEAIEATQAVIDQLQVVKKATMAELLTRGLPGRHKRFKQTEIGAVPEEWAVANLGAVARVIDPNPSHRYPPETIDGVPIVSTANFEGLDDYDLASAPHVPNATFIEQNERCRFAPDDVVFARKGRIGFARSYGSMKKVFSHTVVTMKANQERLLPAFLLWVARSSSFLGQLERTMNTNSGVPTLGVKIIAETFMPVPMIAEQERIAASLCSLSACELVEEATLRAHRSVKEALMSVLLTGEVRVMPDEEAA